MKRNVFRLITVCAMVALLCGATLCFSLPSAAENLLTDSWAALDDTQSAYVSYAGGVLTIDAATPNVDVKAYQTLNLGAGSYKLSVTKSSNDLSFTVQYPGGEASEVKYDEGYVDFTMASAGEVTITAFQYRGILGTASNMTLVSVGGSSETTQGGQVVTEPVASQPQGGSTLTDNWVALDDSQSAAVSCSGGVLSINAGLVEGDVKAGQTLNLAAGTYTLTATKSGDPMSFSAKWPGNEVGETEGKLTFTLTSATEVQIIAYQYRGTSGTASNIVLSGGGSQPTSIVTEPVVTEPVVTEPVVTQPQGGSELTDNWVALDDSQAAAVSCSGGVLTINAGLVEGDVKAGQTLNLAAGTYTLTATKSGDPMSFSAKWPGNEVGETEGKLTFTLTSATEVQIIAYQYRGTSGTASNIVLSGGGSQPTSIVTDPVSSETQPVVTEPVVTQPQGGSTLTDNWVALDDSQAAAVSCSGGVLSINAGLVEGDVKAGQTLNLAAGTYTLTATKSGDPMSFSAKWPGNEVGETEGKLTFTLTAATEVQIIAYQYRGTSGTASNIVLSGGGSQPTSIVTDPSTVVTDPSTPSGGTNLIVNGSFNNGLSGWTLTNIDENSAKVQNGALVVNQANGWHVDIRPTISGTIKPNTQYTLKYEASDVKNLQVAVHLAPGFGGGATMIAQPGETSFTTASDLTAADFYVTLEIVADGDVAGTFDNFVLVEGTNTDVTEPSVNPTQPGTNPTSVNPGQTGKVVVWSGTINRDFTSKSNGFAAINEDALTQAFRDDIAANGVPQKYEIEAVASYVSGPSGYACYGFYQDSPYLEFWADKGGSLTKSTLSDAASLKQLNATAGLWLFSEAGGDITHIDSLTLYAYREGGTVVTDPSTIVTDPTQPIVTDPIVTDPTQPIVTDPSTSETDPSQPTDGKVLVWAGNLNADYTTVNGVAAINDQGMMMAVVGELMTNGVPEQVEVKSELAYLGGDSGFAAIGLYSNGQVIWPDDGCPIDDVTFSNLSGLGADTALVVFSYGTDTVHIDNMEIYVKRAQAVVTDPSSSGSEEVNPGDANGDGAINMKDVLALRKLLADMPTGDFNEANADVNGDGSVNMKDVLALRKMLAN